ncbi:MAG: hypothetical protein AMS26_01090 [Bacteroides sp. SM23_62]|nr:MAG: hypothetical protein AMS26_01090 [Bacteroides sp. SM23_62]
MTNKTLTYLYILWAISIPFSLWLMQIFLGIIFLYTIILAVKEKQIPFKAHPVFIFWSIYLVLGLLSAILSPDALRSLKVFINVEWTLLSVPILSSLALSSQDAKKILNALIISGSIVSVYAIYQFLTGVDIILGNELGSLGNYYRAVGLYNFYLTFAGNQLMIYFICFIYFINEKKWNRNKYLYLAAMILLISSLYATYARSTWLALFAVLIVGSILHDKKLILKIIIPIIIVSVLLLIFIPDLNTRFLSIFDMSQNEGRLNLWSTSVKLIKDHIWHGIGPAYFPEMAEKYKVPGFYDTMAHAHNDALHIAVLNGIPAALAWIGMWILWLYWMIKRIYSLSFSQGQRQSLFGIAMSIASILIAGFFQCYYFDLENNILWMFLVIISFRIKSNED